LKRKRPEGADSRAGIVDDPEELRELVSRLGGQPAVAVDTEFHGEKRYWPELFLVQVADRRGPALVDPLAVEDLSPLAEVMADPDVVKVIHSASNDIGIINREVGRPLTNVFDTQLAAAFLGYGQQCSLSKLLRKVCGISPKKRFSLSDWSARPLARKQVEYALDDVRWLLKLYDRLRAELDQRGRLDWFHSEARELCDPGRYGVDMVRVFRRARSSGKLKRHALPVLWALVRWREERAMESDRPRKRILRDFQLARIAGMAPRNRESLQTLRGIPSGFLERYGDQVLEVVNRALEEPPEDVPPPPAHTRSRRGSPARRDMLRIFLGREAERLGIARHLLLPKEAQRALAAAPPRNMEELRQVEGMTGWRADLLGERILRMFKGRLALVLDPAAKGGMDLVDLEED
jgi:ribonuclease D